MGPANLLINGALGDICSHIYIVPTQLLDGLAILRPIPECLIGRQKLWKPTKGFIHEPNAGEITNSGAMIVEKPPQETTGLGWPSDLEKLHNGT